MAIRRSTLVPLVGAPAIYVVGAFVAGFSAVLADGAWPPILFAFGGAAAFFAWRTMRWPDAAARYLAFGAVLLLACVANRVLYVADFALAGPRLDEWPFPVGSPEFAIFKGELLTVGGTLISVLAWAGAGGLRLSPNGILTRLRGYGVQLWAIYLMSLAAVASMQMFPAAAAALGQLAPTLQGLGIVSGVLLPLMHARSAYIQVPLVLALSVPFMLASADSGMKEAIILTLLPVAAIVWMQTRALIGRAFLVLTGVVALSLITSYVGYFRDAVWRNPSGGATTEQVFEDFVNEVGQVGVAPTVADGWAKFMARSNASVGRGWAVAMADEQQFQPELIFGPLVYVFIPRAAWPEKPAIRPGWEFSALVFGPAYTMWSDSSTAAGFYPALYLGFGWWAFIAGSILAGFVIAKASQVAQRLGGNICSGLFMLTMVPFALRMDEQWPSGVFSAPIVALVYLLAIFAMTRVLIPRQSKRIRNMERRD